MSLKSTQAATTAVSAIPSQAGRKRRAAASRRAPTNARRTAIDAAIATRVDGRARTGKSLDTLFDIARNSVNQQDRSLATTAVFSLRDVMLGASRERARLPFDLTPATGSSSGGT